MNASIFIPSVIKGCNGASLQPYFGEELSVLTLRKKHSFLKGQVKRIQARFTYLNSLLRGASLRRRGAPWWRILTKRAAIAAMRPHCAVFCHRSIAADCCPARFANEFRRRAFNASPAFQSVRWLFRSIGPESRTPSYSLLSARADAFRTPCAIQCRLSILWDVLVVFFLVAFVLGRNKKSSSR